ncbi:MAG: NAD(P)-dependent oxidoreductase [Pseudomonadota bacterium]
MAKLERLLVTGAAGGLARLVRDNLAKLAHSIRLSDIADPGEIGAAEFVECDLADRAGVEALVKGCDGIIHLGGISKENTFETILQSNIIGVRNIYDAAQNHGQPRILFASSNHVVGFYGQDEYIGADAAHQPDSWYGVSKSFGEAAALMYWRKFGQESALVRIGSCFDVPADRRMQATWLAPEDFVSLAERVFYAPRLGCPVIYGVSDNEAVWWDNSATSYLGWKPQHSSAQFDADVVARNPDIPGKDDPVAKYQGGVFTDAPLWESGAD